MDENKFSQTIQEGGALIKLENQTQMQISLARPRSEKAILADALGELELYPTAAKEAVYNKPVGKNDQGKQIYAQGLSIRAAESIAGRWCNSAYGAEIVSEDGESITIGAVFLDMERNTRHAVSRRVSKSYKSRSGTIVKLVGDRLDMAVNANISKALREVILRSLPAGLKAEYMEKAQEMISKTSPDAIKKAIPKITAYFKKHQITPEMIENFLGKKLSEIDGDDYVELQGICNAVENGELTAKEAFGAPSTTETQKESMAEKIAIAKAKTNGKKPEPPDQDTIEAREALGRIDSKYLARARGKLNISDSVLELNLGQCIDLINAAKEAEEEEKNGSQA